MSDSSASIKSAAILGSGTWGLSLACLLHHKGIAVKAWDAFPHYLADLARTRKHPKLPELEIPKDLQLTNDLAEAAQAELLVMVVASHAVRLVCEQLRDLKLDWTDKTLVLCSKGIEEGSLQTMSEIAESVLGHGVGGTLLSRQPDKSVGPTEETAGGTPLSRNVPVGGTLLSRNPIGVLSGPSHAEEVSRCLPSTVVAASSSSETACRIQEAFMTPHFRVYTHDDVLGVELGAALKNVIAIAAGVCDGLGFGDNARAALITRGLAEMTRLGVAMGARPETFAGLTGMGDLIVTAGSRHSRNHTFGEKIAQGMSAEEAIEEIGMVVEGVKSCASAAALAKKFGVEMPIAQEVHAVLYQGKNPKQASQDLMLRDPKPESGRRPDAI